MLAYIEGRLAEIWDNSCIVVTRSGLGYELALPRPALHALPAKGDDVALYVSLVVREDALELFGFTAFEEKRMFETLLTISKVGARTALSILSIFRPEDLRRIVQEEDPAILARVSGIGKKNAQHIFLELRYKLKADFGPEPALPTAAGGLPAVFRDTLSGLAGLGYSEGECAPLVRRILHAEPDIDVAGAIRFALRQLGKRAAQ
ncbi:MAG: Holliday junction ATP-dependent DNA helicase RuvA [Desulfovibrio sp.]|jgi:Holliday junction DNA helicase RuvA|nr:Holliday junction ATP-dependent DNA helicase RuvA [Desulfovibrio sp.]